MEFRCNDVASEIAFLAMDLTGSGRVDLAERLVASYSDRARDPELRLLLPFYACYRAYVRAKVDGLKSDEPEVAEEAQRDAAARARRHFALAAHYAWSGVGRVLVACAGLSGTGKTALARALGEATGFAHLSTDELRRRPSAAGAGIELPAGTKVDYGRAARDAVYVRLLEEADHVLAHGGGVIADATFIERQNRLRLIELARRWECPAVFLECVADEDTIHRRLDRRSANGASRADDDPARSDARWETYLAQRSSFEPFIEEEDALHFTIDTGRGIEEARSSAVRRLWSALERT
jgi:hypothetical protein